MGDLSLFHDKPVLTVSSTFKAVEDYKEFLKGRESNQHLRNEFAKEHCGLTGYINPTGLDSTDVYPTCMHRVFNCLSSICIRVDRVHQSVMQEKRKSKCLENVSKVAKKIDRKRKLAKFDSISVPVFFDKFEKFLADLDIKGLLLTILSSYFKGLKSVPLSVLNTSPEVCANTFEAEGRCFLAAASVFIFGSHLITPSMYQVATLQRFYIMKIKQNPELIGCRIGLNNISDDVKEGYHRHGNQGKFLFSGGKGGPTGKIEYQKNVLRQQFQNE